MRLAEMPLWENGVVGVHDEAYIDRKVFFKHALFGLQNTLFHECDTYVQDFRLIWLLRNHFSLAHVCVQPVCCMPSKMAKDLLVIQLPKTF
jgi:hypothetical protein